MTSSTVVKGMVFKRLVEGDVNRVEKAKIAVYSCPLDVTQTETKVCTIPQCTTTPLYHCVSLYPECVEPSVDMIQQNAHFNLLHLRVVPPECS